MPFPGVVLDGLSGADGLAFCFIARARLAIFACVWRALRRLADFFFDAALFGTARSNMTCMPVTAPVLRSSSLKVTFAASLRHLAQLSHPRNRNIRSHGLIRHAALGLRGYVNGTAGGTQG